MDGMWFYEKSQGKQESFLQEILYQTYDAYI